MGALPEDRHLSSETARINVTAAEARMALFMAQLGALSRWCWSPTAILLGSPFRWCAMIAVTARAESVYDPAAVGDNGSSIGIMMFNTQNKIVQRTIPIAMRETTTGIAEVYRVTDSGRAALVNLAVVDWRLSPFWSGWYAVENITSAVWTDPRYWGIRLPWFGTWYLRVLWKWGDEGYDRGVSAGYVLPEPTANAAMVWGGMTQATHAAFWLLFGFPILAAMNMRAGRRR